MARPTNLATIGGRTGRLHARRKDFWVSVENNIAAAEIGGADAPDLVYAGFWRRLGAYAIDFAILAPFGLLTKNLVYTSRDAFLVRTIVGVLIAILFEVYLVKRFGGSPGKLILNVRIAQLDGSPVGYRQAWIRYSVLLFITTMSSIGLLIGLFDMPDAEYAAFAAAHTSLRSLEASAPAWYHPLEIVGAIWLYSEFIVLLTNKKRRALHDFMAGTVVIRDTRKMFKNG
jgi:uncharacterized RDD family membrane protein YckC